MGKFKRAAPTALPPERAEARLAIGIGVTDVRIVVPSPHEFVLGAENEIKVTDSAFPFRMVFLPPGAELRHGPDPYVLLGEARLEAPGSIMFPTNAAGFLFADLAVASGWTPPKPGDIAGRRALFAAIASAIQSQVGPPPPDGTTPT